MIHFVSTNYSQSSVWPSWWLNPQPPDPDALPAEPLVPMGSVYHLKYQTKTALKSYIKL